MTSSGRAPARTGPRRKAREFVLQGLYQRQLSGNAAAAIREHIADIAGFDRCDRAYFDALWTGTIAEFDDLVARCAPHCGRKPAELSPIERAVLVIGAWELRHRLEIPYAIVINEAIVLAKGYGGTDGYKFVNGVLDKLAQELRAPEIAALARTSAADAADVA